MTSSTRPPGKIIPRSRPPKDLVVIEESPLEIPDGWFTILQVKSTYSQRGLRDVLSRMVVDGQLQTKTGKVKLKTGMRTMNIYKKI